MCWNVVIYILSHRLGIYRLWAGTKFTSNTVLSWTNRPVVIRISSRRKSSAPLSPFASLSMQVCRWLVLLLLAVVYYFLLDTILPQQKSCVEFYFKLYATWLQRQNCIRLKDLCIANSVYILYSIWFLVDLLNWGFPNFVFVYFLLVLRSAYSMCYF